MQKKSSRGRGFRDIVVIGSSAGGIGTLERLVANFPRDLPASVFIAQHLASDFKSYLASILSKNTSLSVVEAQDLIPIQHRQIYVSIPDYHLLIEDKKVRLGHGPKQNGHRPSVDALFVSAAHEFESRVIGVVLTGALDCGTAGLLEIKKYGGLAVVQDPHDATVPDMPASALRHVPVDYCLPISEMGALLSQLVSEPVDMNREKSRYSDLIPASTEPYLSSHICPECNGPLWCVETGKLLHYHCHTGHVFSGESLLARKTEEVEKLLWATATSLEQKADLAKRLAERAGNGKYELNSSEYLKQAYKAEAYSKAVVDLTGQPRGDLQINKSKPEPRAEETDAA